MYLSKARKVWVDIDTKKDIGPDGSDVVADEKVRRAAGIPPDDWKAGTKTMSPGDPRRLKLGGKLGDRPEQPGPEQDEWDTSNRIEAKRAEDKVQKEKQGRLNARFDRPLSVADNTRGYVLVYSLAELYALQARQEREIQERAERGRQEMEARRRQWEYDNRERLAEERERRQREAEDQARLNERRKMQREDREWAEREHGAPGSFAPAINYVPLPVPVPVPPR